MYCVDNQIDSNDDDEEELDSRKNQPEFSLLLTHHMVNAKIYHGHCKGNTTVEICAHCQNRLNHHCCPHPLQYVPMPMPTQLMLGATNHDKQIKHFHTMEIRKLTSFVSGN